MSGQASSGDRRWSIVLASREVWPFVEGGGIGRYMWAAAGALAPHADVTLLTSSSWQERHDELARSGDGRLPEGVGFAFADEPTGDLSPFVSWSHLWSLRLLEGAARLYPDGGPDVLEMADYQAEAFAAAHARRGLDPRLRNTMLAVGLHTSAEMCARYDDQPDDPHMHVLSGLERFALRFADGLLWPGGNVLERYFSFYGGDALAPGIRRSLPAAPDVTPQGGPPDSPESGPLRLLYLNRLQSLKGIAELVTAVRSLPDADLRVTVAGRDTPTGPDGTSMRAHVERLAVGDPRIELIGEVPHAGVPALIAAHHAVVVPSRWEASSYVVREALACNRPVLATPVGGIVDVVRPDESGWLARSSEPEDLAAALAEMLSARAEVAAMIAEGRPRAALEKDAGEDRLLAAYRTLLERAAEVNEVAETGDGAEPRDAGRAAGSGHSRIDAIVVSEFGGGDPLPTLLSLERQHGVSVYPLLAVGPSGGFPGPGPALARSPLVTADGLGAGSAGLVLVAPAGAELEPDFLRRAAAALAAEPALAWVTSLVRNGSKPTDAPLGSYALPRADVDATTALALVRRDALEGFAREGVPDDLFARLAESGAHGLVLQEPLIANLPRRARRPLSPATSASG